MIQPSWLLHRDEEVHSMMIAHRACFLIYATVVSLLLLRATPKQHLTANTGTAIISSASTDVNRNDLQITSNAFGIYAFNSIDLARFLHVPSFCMRAVLAVTVFLCSELRLQRWGGASAWCWDREPEKRRGEEGNVWENKHENHLNQGARILLSLFLEKPQRNNPLNSWQTSQIVSWCDSLREGEHGGGGGRINIWVGQHTHG